MGSDCGETDGPPRTADEGIADFISAVIKRVGIDDIVPPIEGAWLVEGAVVAPEARVEGMVETVGDALVDGAVVPREEFVEGIEDRVGA